MTKRLRKFFLSVFALSVALLISFCGNKRHSSNPSGTKDSFAVADPWLGHTDSAHYVGINTCRQCHYEIYNTFIKTGMGQSFDSAGRAKSSARMNEHTVIYDKTSDFYYHPFWKNEKYFIREFRLEKSDTVFNRVEQVNYIIGSGQHTNSHIFNTNGYLHQMPMTFYTQKGTWDLPPGFENGSNTRFSRKIGLECMSCHNAYPDYVQGSENKYNKVMNGIDCERCHGPGSIHVALKQTGVKVDTSKYADYSIVNPGKLSIDRQFDVCMRCHLQGNAILKPGKSFFDFKPGMTLSDFISVFMPRYEGADDQFIMASHAARLKMSQCFVKSLKSGAGDGSLRPYKEALTCVTCHNPHVSVKVTGTEVFNNACKNCHQAEKKTELCTASSSSRMAVADNCVGCHMPRSGSVDIPHVTVHDHYIRKPKPLTDIAGVKKFIGLYAVNEERPTPVTRALAYVNYYEKFNPQNPALLDSALFYLHASGSADEHLVFAGLIQIWFLKRDYRSILALVVQKGKEWVMNSGLASKSYSNSDAWTAYRIGEACVDLDKKEEASLFLRRATELSPYNLDFQSKLGITLLDLHQQEESARVFDFILSEDPKYASAWNNRGRIYFYNHNFDKAGECINKALALDPDLLPALKNQVDLLNEQHRYEQAKQLLMKISRRFPQDTDAKLLLKKMKDLKLIS